MRFARPATALASCNTRGRPVATPISAPGNDAKPPKPSTTDGLRRRMIDTLSMQAARSAYGPSSSVRNPLPRTPRNAMPSNSTPCSGTSFASRPPRVPSQNTDRPRATSFAATARPGKMWPPVPPVVIITVALTTGPPRLRLSPLRCPPRGSTSRRGAARRRSYGEPSQQSAVLVIDPQQDRERDAVGDDAAAAEGEQRQRQALRRQHAHVDAHVDERLHADPHADSPGDETRERPLEPRGLTADRVRAIQDPHEQRDHDRHAEKSELFRNHREQEIGVRLGQI